MSTGYSIEQMNQLAGTLGDAGYTSKDVARLCLSAHQLTAFKGVLSGAAQIIPIKHIIDLDAAPFVPNGWQVEEHIEGGQFEWDPAKAQLFLSEGQRDGKWIQGHQLREELKGKNPYNANLLDYLLAHPELIPEEWEYVFFWGTIYHDRFGLGVRCLCRRGVSWRWFFSGLVGGFLGRSPAAVPV